MKYKVYGIMTACTVIGTYEADTREEAIEKSENDTEGNWYPSLCHQCARDVEIGEIYRTETDELE